MNSASSNLIEGRPVAGLVLFFVMLAVGVGIGVWDGIAIYRGDPADTVSDIFRAWSRSLPLIPFIFGFLVCHILGLGAGMSSLWSKGSS